MDESATWSVTMAVGCGLVAAFVGVVVLDGLLGNTVGSFDLLFVPPAAVAAAVLGGTFWWALVEHPGRPTEARATLVGFAVGLLAHPVMWLLYLFGGSLFLQTAPPEVDFAVEYALSMSAFSVLLAGGLTVIGGVCCGLTVLRLRRRDGRSSSR